MDKPDRLSIKSFLKSFISEAFNFERGIFKSTVCLIKNPGYLSSAYIYDLELKYVHPLKLYFIINFIFFMIMPVLNTPRFQVFNHNLNALIKDNIVYQQIIENEAELKNIPQNIYEERFNAHFRYNQPAFLFLIIPFFAFALYLLNFRKKKYYVSHLIFSTHYLSFFLIYLLILTVCSRILMFFMKLLNFQEGYFGLVFVFTVAVGLFIYLLIALYKFYKSSISISILKSIILYVSFIFTYVIYIKLLFFYTVVALKFGY